MGFSSLPIASGLDYGLKDGDREAAIPSRTRVPDILATHLQDRQRCSSRCTLYARHVGHAI